MAKITALTEKTYPQSTDLVPVVDMTGTPTTKKVTLDNLLNRVDPYDQPDLPYASSGLAMKCIDLQIVTKYDTWDFLSQAQMNLMMSEAKATGANFVAFATPYSKTAKYASWVATARAYGMKVWFRSHWNEWEGDQSVGNVTSLTRSGSTATCTTTTNHGLQTGDTVSMNGMNETLYRGEFVVTVTGANTFTYTVTGSPTTPATGSIGWRYGRATYLRKTVAFIIANPTLFQPGDFFTTCVESSQADAQSMTFKTPGTTTFDISLYKQFEKDQVFYANQAFDSIGLHKQIHTWAISTNVSLLDLGGITWNATAGNSSGLDVDDIHTYFKGRLCCDHYQDANVTNAEEYRLLVAADIENFKKSYPGCVWLQGEMGYHTEDTVTDANQNDVLTGWIGELLKVKEVVGVNFWVNVGSDTTSLWEDVDGTLVAGGRLAVRGAITPAFTHGSIKSAVQSEQASTVERNKINFEGSNNTLVEITDDPELNKVDLAVIAVLSKTIAKNYMPNPSFEVNLESWTAYGTHGTIARDTNFDQSGAASMKQDNGVSSQDGGMLSDPITLPAGTYTFSVYAKLSSTVVNASMIVREVGGSTLGSGVTQAYPGNTNFNRYSFSFTIATTKVVEVLLGMGSYGSASPGVVYYDAVQLEEAAAATTYFDGSLADSGDDRFYWAGAPDNSLSVRATIDELTRANVQRPMNVVVHNGATVWTDMPSAETEAFGDTDRRTKVDLTEYIQCRVAVGVKVAGSTGAKIKIQYSTNESAWADLTATATVDATGVKVSAWANIPALALADVFIRAVGLTGNGSIDPNFTSIMLQVK